ncbi:substrate-binding domain-containing protein [Nocardioides sp. cx-173]|uniref:substrate-binding domain-containing protein n=1 Tax=Nocardioides sp. cx-173 TaxID=2898796 RepID=UPI001E30D116|nr:substrate-binding domain-containing protein [Nocardioides sp. cx-173]MCD4523374.1 substrate-binding domain-containing protein [Nocardioides sp. cx-173]UGB42287.1 substrate-binding domain-containing protein [Nocardioides sp. cx-173]
MSLHHRTISKKAAAALAVLAAIGLSACTSNESSDDDQNVSGGTSEAEEGSNDEAGDTVTIGFSAPAADHGWMGAITEATEAVAEQYDDVELLMAEGTNDPSVQIQQIETFINDGVDAIVLLPHDGDALTPIALEAMEAGIPVVNVDREFNDPNAARVTVLGDNYGMGVSAGEYVCEQADGNTDAVVAEIQGIASLPLTQDRSQGFEDALKECGLDVDNQVEASFTVESGSDAANNLLQAAPQIDFLWNHDDDQGVGVLAAIEEAGRDEFTMIGGAGSRQVMEAIKADNGVLKATVIYPSTQGADGLKLARLLAQEKSVDDLVEVEVPRVVQLYAPVVTAENVDKYLDTAFRS